MRQRKRAGITVAGKALILIIALPLFSELMDVIKAILEIK